MIMNTKTFNYRQFIANNLKELNKTYGKKLNQKVRLSDFDSVLALIKNNRKEASALIEKHFNDEFTLTVLYLMSLSSMAASLDHRNNKRVFPAYWITETGRPLADLVFSNMISQIANYSCSILSLLEQGLHFPAKSLLRVNNELIWQTLVLCYDRNMLIEYCSAEDEAGSNKIWYKLFSKGRLNKKVSEIEKIIGMNDDYVSELMSWRRETQKHYSDIIHNSYFAVNIGIMAFDFNTEDIHSGLLGRACPTIKVTIDLLNHQLFFFTEMFITVLGKVHNIKLDPKNMWGYTAIVTRNICSKIMIKLGNDKIFVE